MEEHFFRLDSNSIEESNIVAISNLGPCVLEGRLVRLEPLRKKHTDELTVAAGRLDFGWAMSPLRSRDDVLKRIQRTLELENKNEGYAFIVRLKNEDRIVGSTSYFGIVREHRRAEIGYTWYEQSLWGSYVNPESKYLLLKHAFDDWNANRIQISTDIKNIHSQKAIQKLGAQYEGTLRHHAIRPDGTIRDTMMYSITSIDWPRVKQTLEERLTNYANKTSEQNVAPGQVLEEQ
ncbi:MAG TPA: GNAT family protein [Candidatus Dormibacteraeota bacterium]|jgi:RimJ/RimL family protein N-acetyltransferase|nr:GNAT family protein [Candidatus Dormibacteraeota bacterium]